jgi:acyl-[acyl-carrier-protein] desaturase
MASSRPLTPDEILLELEPYVARNLDRHIAQAGEWFPHDFVPYEQGRNFVAEPWKPEDSHLPDIAGIALELNLLTEDNLPFYTLALTDAFGRTEAWGEWIRRWTAEEGRHSIVLRDYLTVTRGVDPVALEQDRMAQVQEGYYPEWPHQTPFDGIVYPSLQELATRISHRNTGTATQDEGALRILQRVATDENLHYLFYRELGEMAMELDPSQMMLAIRRQVMDFAMPGVGIPGFKAKARAMAEAGIYNFRIHHDQILVPVLLKHWRIDQVEDLTDEAKVARDDVMRYMAKLDRVSSRLDERSTPVGAELRGPRALETAD